MKQSVIFVILAISMGASTGCTMMSDVGANMSKSMRMFRPRPFDDDMGGSEEDTERSWASMIKEARPDAERERDPDRFWFEKVLSPKARSINNNLGFE